LPIKAWEDSIENKANMSWTPSLPRRFQQKHGYSLLKYLPLMMFGQSNVNIQATQPGPYQCILDTEDGGAGYINDFRDTLTDLYSDYVLALRNWTQDTLALQLSVQPAYNLPMDMEAVIPDVPVPECESLQFADNVDGYRQFSGPANLAHRRIISNEVGAYMGETYRLTVARLLFSINRAFSGGVNQFVVHGQPYSGDYYNTTWPGYTAFSYSTSENWSPKFPVWDHGLRDAMDYIARTQFIQRTGVPKIDVVIFNKASATNPNFPTLYPASDLVDEGVN
jgi:hypothetical protein